MVNCGGLRFHFVERLIIMIKVFIASVRQYNIKYPRFALIYILLAAVAAVSSIISIQATGNMAQAATIGVTGEMMSFLLILAIAGIVQALSWGVLALIEKRFFSRVICAIRRTFAERLLRMPYKEFSTRNSGEGASLFTVDVPRAASFLTTQTLSQISQVTTLLVSVAFMLVINWWLSLAYFVLFPVLALLQSKIAGPIGKKREEASKRRAEYNAVVSDSLQNPLTVLAYGLEASVEQRFDTSFAEYYKAEYSSARTTAVLALIGILATFLPTFAFYFASCAVVISGRMSVAEFISLTIIAGPAASWISMFAQELARLQTTMASAVRVADFVPEIIIENEGVKDITPTADYAVSFDNVSFGYGDGTRVFDKASFVIDKENITAIAGQSGCGKSTALKLMLGLYTPDGGQISLSSANITYVPQDCYLLPVSIRDNIVAGLPMDEEKLKASCESAGIYEFVQELPDGLNAILTESAANVSGGQKQRLAMARAFYRDADLLLLDEATSALDPVTEQAVLESFRRYIKDNGKTAVVVAHRQAVLDMSDRIITLQKEGKV